MNHHWPVRVTWRASFILCACIASPAWGDARGLVVEARTQDPARVAAWAEALTRGDGGERAAAAFALGQLGAAWEPPPEEARARAEGALVAALGREHDATVRDRVVEALGKVGARAAAAPLARLLAGPERRRAALALAALAKNKAIVEPAATAPLLALLHDADAGARFAAATALLRRREPSTRGALAGCLADAAVQVRATCAKALADVGGDAEVPALARLVGDGDVRVAAEAARTLVKLAMKCADGAPCAAAEALTRTARAWPPPVMHAIAFEHWRGAAAATALGALEDAVAAARGYDDGAAVACELAMAHDRARGRIERLRGCGPVAARVRQRRLAEALADAGGAELATLARSRWPEVREAAADGADAATTLRLLGDRDPAVVEAAAQRVGALGLTAAAPALAAALARLHGPDAVEAEQAILETAAKLGLQALVPAARRLVDADPYALRLAAAHALAALTHAAVTARLPSLPSGAPPSLPPTVVRLRTRRGTIRLRLWTDEAPRTAANFVALVRRRFYDGLTFHRVVPNYVSQGGDPKGDGSGGPGYMIPCEIGMRRYGEGVLGMALAGRDTGGSQFFITHAPTPQLDGRYTAFGEVIDGLDVAVHLVEGDTILEARVE